MAADKYIQSLRRVAREAQNTYVGRHWPTMADMLRDGIGYGLSEDSTHEQFIRKFLYEFQPEFALDLLDSIATREAEAAAAALSAARARVEAVPRQTDWTDLVYRASVLAALEGEDHD